MMMGPKAYIYNLRDKSFEELLHERDEIIERMKRYESDDIPKEREYICPSPGVQYSVSYEYLIELCKYITHLNDNRYFQDFNSLINSIDGIDKYRVNDIESILFTEKKFDENHDQCIYTKMIEFSDNKIYTYCLRDNGERYCEKTVEIPEDDMKYFFGGIYDCIRFGYVSERNQNEYEYSLEIVYSPLHREHIDGKIISGTGFLPDRIRFFLMEYDM